MGSADLPGGGSEGGCAAGAGEMVFGGCTGSFPYVGARSHPSGSAGGDDVAAASLVRSHSNGLDMPATETGCFRELVCVAAGAVVANRAVTRGR